MIYTVTFNPAIDYVLRTGAIRMGETNRSEGEEIYYGGKGINISFVLKELGFASVALGFVAGFTGMAIEKEVCRAGIETDFIHLSKGFSRINVKLKALEETEINGQGPEIRPEDFEQLLNKMDCLQTSDTLVLAGSIPKTMQPDSYERILRHISDRQVRTVVDASGELLLRVLKYRPYLVKPNKQELEELFDTTLYSHEEVVLCARKMQEHGARNVLVSMAADGALLIDENGKEHFCKACKGEVRNSVGAGDSMVAGFLAGMQNGDYAYALKLGTAAGGATAFADGLAKRTEIDRLFKLL